jgi:hypothetical protein
MITTSKLILLLLAVALLGVSPENVANSPSSEGPEYTSDGQLMLPQHYRDWGFLTSDFHTTSDPAKPQAGEHRLFNNIFVNPGAYKGFLQTGTWPDKAMLVVEQRTAEDMGSSNPNQKGTGQSSVIGIGVHVKDETRFPEKWAFFGFQGGKKTAGKIPATAACYSCQRCCRRRRARTHSVPRTIKSLRPILQQQNNWGIVCLLLRTSLL